MHLKRVFFKYVEGFKCHRNIPLLGTNSLSLSYEIRGNGSGVGRIGSPFEILLKSYLYTNS